MHKRMKHTLLLWTLLALMTGALLASPAAAQAPHWSGNDELSFLFEINGISIADSNTTAPIQVAPNETLALRLSINVSTDIVLKSGEIVMRYMSIPFINQPFEFNVPVPNGTVQELMNTTLSLADALGTGGISLFSGSIDGYVSFTYSLITSPDTNKTVSDDFVIAVGQTGLGSLLTVSGMVTLVFTIVSIFGLLFALDDFQGGILAARMVRAGGSPREIKVFPPQVVLRRRPKKKELDVDSIKRHVKEVAGEYWNHRRCPKCGKKWPKDGDACGRCKTTEAEAKRAFADSLAEKVPQALKVMRPKSKMTVGRFSKRLKMPKDRGGALAAILTDMKVFQTRSVKVPLNKVSMSGMTLAGTYFSWVQILGLGTPSLIDIFLAMTGGLVVSVVVAYFMNWLARVPRLGYEDDTEETSKNKE